MLLMRIFWGCFILNWTMAVLCNVEVSSFFNNEGDG